MIETSDRLKENILSTQRGPSLKFEKEMQFLNQQISTFIYEFPKIPLLSENAMALNAPVNERCKWWLLGNGWRNYFKDVRVAGNNRTYDLSNITLVGYSNHWATGTPVS